MIEIAEGAALDLAIEASLARIRDRAAEVGPRFAALGDAITRAARGGKRFRPALVTASFRSFPDADPGASPSAAKRALWSGTSYPHPGAAIRNLVDF